MTEYNIVLPYPPPELNPNKRLHWAKKIKLKNDQKTIGFIAAKTIKEKLGDQDIELSLVFFPKDNRHYDLDNALSNSKAVLDGLAQGLGVNDKQFRPIKIDRGVPDKKNPRVEITLSINARSSNKSRTSDCQST